MGLWTLLALNLKKSEVGYFVKNVVLKESLFVASDVVLIRLTKPHICTAD